MQNVVGPTRVAMAMKLGAEIQTPTGLSVCLSVCMSLCVSVSVCTLTAETVGEVCRPYVTVSCPIIIIIS